MPISRPENAQTLHASGSRRQSQLVICRGATLRRWPPVFVASLLSWTLPAAGQEPIEEIQVTATRRPAAVSEVSAALTVVSAGEIARAKLVTDALAARPGVFLQQTTPGQGAAIIRGLKGSEVLHLVDGMRLNNAIFRNAPTQYMALVAPGSIDRVEVVRGAPASLYGSDAVGGVVHALSRIPAFDMAGARFDATLAFDTADQARMVRAAAEFGDESLAALFSGEYLETGNRRVGGGDRVVPSAYDARGARIAVSATPTDTERWLFDLQFAEQPMTPRVDELVPGFGQLEPSSSEFFFAPNQRLFAHVRHTRDDGLWGATWTFDAGWQRIVDDRMSRNYQSDIRRREGNRSDLAGLTLNANGNTGSGSWVAGVEYYYDRVASTRIEEDLVTGIETPVAARFPDGSTMTQAALFGSYSHRLNGRHTLSGGLRYSAIITRLPGGGTIPATDVDQDDVSADLGWLFDITDRTHITANLGFGFRAPNVFDLGTLGERPGNRFNIPNSDLQSEHITQFDLGLRHFGERWEIDVVVFALHYTDRIASVLTGEITPTGRAVIQSRNVDTADITGLELGGRLLLTDTLAADAVVNVVHGEQSEAAGVSVAGDRIPPVNGRIGLQYQWRDDLLIEPYVVFADAQDRLSPRDIIDPRIDPAGTPGWLTANLRVSWNASETWHITLQLENILDKRYRVHGSGIDSPGQNLYVGFTAGW
jgi:outer membrane receptor protein involved in Fe transport